MLFFSVFAATHPRPSDPPQPPCVRLSARPCRGELCGQIASSHGFSLSSGLCSQSCPACPVCPDPGWDLVADFVVRPPGVTHLESTHIEVLILKNFKLFRMNTYEKDRGEGVVLVFLTGALKSYRKWSLFHQSPVTNHQSPIRSIAVGDLWCHNLKRHETSYRSRETTPCLLVSKDSERTSGAVTVRRCTRFTPIRSGSQVVPGSSF